jgi:hypothetical protein
MKAAGPLSWSLAPAGPGSTTFLPPVRYREPAAGSRTTDLSPTAAIWGCLLFAEGGVLAGLRGGEGSPGVQLQRGELALGRVGCVDNIVRADGGHQPFGVGENGLSGGSVEPA